MLKPVDKIFAIGISAAFVIAMGYGALKAVWFWNDMETDLDPAATVPMILGILFSLVVGALVIGVYFYGRRREVERDGSDN